MAYPAPATATALNRPTAPVLRAVGGTGRDFAGRAADAGISLSAPLQIAGLVVDLAGYVVTLDGQELDLSPRQVELLALFLAAPRKVWSRDQLHWVCWGDTAPSRRGAARRGRPAPETGPLPV